MPSHYTVTVTPNTLLYAGHSSGEFLNNSAFAVIKDDGSVLTWGNSAAGGSISAIATELNGTIDVAQIYSSDYAFAALRNDGSVVAWGESGSGGSLSAVATALNGTIDVTQIYSTGFAFAALRSDGSVITWGNSVYGGTSTTVATQLNGDTDVIKIYSTYYAFAALRTDGSVITWGESSYGGLSTTVALMLNGTVEVTQIVSTNFAFAALRTDGSVITWGASSGGGSSTTVASAINGDLDVTQMYATKNAFAALRSDGSVITWGLSTSGGDSSAVASALNGALDVTQIIANGYAFAAIRSDGSVITWGDSVTGGNSTAVASKLNGDIKVTQIVATDTAFAAIRSDGSVITWGLNTSGGDSSAVASAINGDLDVTQIIANGYAFAAIRSDGSVITWGNSLFGGDSSQVATVLNGAIDVARIYATAKAFVALRTDGSVVTWGESDNSAVASQLSSGVVSFADIATNDVYQGINNSVPTGTALLVNSKGTTFLVDGTENIPYIVNNSQLIQGFADANNDALTAINLTIDHGSVLNNNDGSWTLIPTTDFGGLLSLSYTVTDGYGGSIMATQYVNIILLNELPTGEVSISGNAQQGQVLMASHTLVDREGFSSIGYQWFADGRAITNATSPILTLTQEEVDKVITVRASYTDGAGNLESKTSTGTALISNINDAPQRTVTLSLLASLEDTPYVLSSSDLLQGFTDADDDILTVINVSTDYGSIKRINGYWTFIPLENYNGETTLTYTVTDGYGGTTNTTQQLRVIPVNDLATGTVTISGEPVQDQQLIADASFADLEGVGTVSYQWLANGVEIKATTDNFLVLTQEAVGKSISVVASYIDSMGTRESKASNVTDVVTNRNDAPTGTLTIIGEAQQGVSLTTRNTLIDEDGLGAITYQWRANGVTVGMGSQFSLTQAEINKVLTVTATYTDDFGTQESITSQATAAVLNKNDLPTGNLILSAAMPRVWQAIRVTNTLADEDGLGDIAYSWKREGTVVGTGNSYTPSVTDIGKALTITARYTDQFGEVEQVSTASAIVQGFLSVTMLNGTNVTKENGESVSIGLSLSVKPANDVRVSFISSDTSKGVVNITEMTFTTTTWFIQQRLTVTGQNNYQPDSTQSYNIMANIDSADLKYKQLVSIELMNAEDIALSNIGIIPQGTPRDTSLRIEGDSLFDVTVIDPETRLYQVVGIKPLNDVLQGLDGNDSLIGGAFDDRLLGGIGNDLLEGGLGNDSLNGGVGRDTLIGGIGDDVYYLTDEALDKIKDNGLVTDNDMVIIPAQWLRYTLPQDIEHGTLDAGKSASTLTGNRSNNLLIGNDADNILQGSAGHDSLYGGAGNDVLNGGVGNDVLQGGYGVDSLLGGKGKDQFAIYTNLNASPEHILDFTPRDDTINLDYQLFTQLKMGALPNTQFSLSTHALNKKDYLFYDAKTGNLYYDTDGTGEELAVKIALLGKNLAITAEDFMVM